MATIEVLPVITHYQKYIKPKLVNEEFRKKRYASIWKAEKARKDTNPEYRQKVNETAKERYKNNLEYQEKKKEKMREYMKQYYQKKKLEMNNIV